MPDAVTPPEERGQFRVECPECEYGNGPELRQTAEWYKRKHKRRTGHECDIEEVESDE